MRSARKPSRGWRASPATSRSASVAPCVCVSRPTSSSSPMIRSHARPASRRCSRRSRTDIRRPRSPLIEGVLLLDKPAGLTSHDAIASARRALGTRRIGHLGTLDPFATGLLVLLVGRVTRLAPYMDGEPKVYDATVSFGSETDTDDLTGAPTTSAPPPDREAAARAMAMLTGSIEQTPPAYSAKQVGGVRAYAAARRGAPLELRSTRVEVHGWVVREWRGTDVDVTITCAGGTYIRALARDLGRLADSAAHLSALRRTRSGPFHV